MTAEYILFHNHDFVVNKTASGVEVMSWRFYGNRCFFTLEYPINANEYLAWEMNPVGEVPQPIFKKNRKIVEEKRQRELGYEIDNSRQLSKTGLLKYKIPKETLKAWRQEGIWFNPNTGRLSLLTFVQGLQGVYLMQDTFKVEPRVYQWPARQQRKDSYDEKYNKEIRKVVPIGIRILCDRLMRSNAKPID